MNPGIELDALVAEKILGCKVERDVPTGYLDPEFDRAPACRCPKGDHEELDFPYRKLRAYSDDIAAAWEVVEKVGLSVAQLAYSESWWSGPLLNSFGSRANAGEVVEMRLPDYGCYGETAPHAICLAALKLAEANLLAKPKPAEEAGPR